MAEDARVEASKQELLFRRLVAERETSEAALREREADLRLVLNSATDAIYCVDTDGVTTMCNAAFLRMLGIDGEEMAIGKMGGTRRSLAFRRAEGRGIWNRGLPPQRQWTVRRHHFPHLELDWLGGEHLDSAGTIAGLSAWPSHSQNARQSPALAAVQLQKITHAIRRRAQIRNVGKAGVDRNLPIIVMAPTKGKAPPSR